MLNNRQTTCTPSIWKCHDCHKEGHANTHYSKCLMGYITTRVYAKHRYNTTGTPSIPKVYQPPRPRQVTGQMIA